MAATQVPPGATAHRTVITRDRNGNPVAVDDSPAIPTVEDVQVNGTFNALSVTVTQLQDVNPTNITGYFDVSFATGALSPGDHVAVKLSCTVDSISITDIAEFVIDPAVQGRPHIDVN